MIKCIPNRYPYNELLLSGKLSAKTRSWKWNHEGLTLLYTSTHKDNEIVDAHGLPAKYDSGVIVGYGTLKKVRPNTKKELSQIEKEFGNGKKSKTVSAAKGAVSVFNVPENLVKKKIKLT